MIRELGLDVIILSGDASLLGELLLLSGLSSRARRLLHVVYRAVSAPLVVGVGKELLLSDGIRGALGPLDLIQVNDHVAGVVQTLRGFKGDRHNQLVGLLRGGSLLAGG